MIDNMEFTALGQLGATRGGSSLDLGPRRQCALLAMLLCHRNQVVGAEELLAGVWGADAPPSGHGLIATYVYRLRRVLAGGPAIERTRAGYRIRLDGANLDTARFSAGVERAGTHRAHGRIVEARTEVGEALALWRGEPFRGLPGPALDAERTRLTEVRMSALEQHAELALRCGEEDVGVSELLSLGERFPLRERLAALLMVALYRTGRQAEALSVFRRTDARLRDELGVEAGQELATVHRAVLRGEEETLSAWAGPRVQAVAVATRRDDLPMAPVHFTGRARELAAIVDARRDRDTAVVVVDGMPGVGKTALVRLAATRLRAAHPDGRFHLDLHGHRAGMSPMSSAEALRRLLVAAGHRGTDIPMDADERAALWRNTLSCRRVLLVLDDVWSTDQVLPLLPSAAGTTVLLAGRPRLPALPATTTLSLPPLTVDEGESLLVRAAGRDSAGQDSAGKDRVADERAAARRLVSSCGGSPALLVAMAGRLRHRPTLSIGDLAERASDPDGLLALARVEGRGAEDLLGPSWSRLCGSQRRTLITLARGGEGIPAAPELVNANLVTETASGALVLPPLVAAFARRSGTPPDRNSVPGTGARRASYVALRQWDLGGSNAVRK